MRRAAGVAVMALCASAAACGRSDLFSAGGRHPGGLGGTAGTSFPDGGGPGGAADGGVDAPLPCQARLEICTNGLDDNCNGLADCLDPGCFGDRACAKPGVEICNNGLDDDSDGRVDCADPDCVASAACRPVMGMEICDNQRDDNGDGLVDCSDPQCAMFAGCLVTRCQPEISFGALAAHGASVSRAFNTVGSASSYATCAPPGGHGRVGEFHIDQITDVRLDFTQPRGSAHVVSLFQAGANQACDQNPVFCLAVGQAASASHTFAGLAAGTYRTIVQSFTGTEGPSTVVLSTGDVTRTEICNNGIDDDGNGLTDCQDATCKSSALCTGSECVPDVNVGALVDGAPPKMVTVNTSTSQNRFHPTCAGGSTAGDRTVAFTLAEPGGVEVAFTESGDHVFGIFSVPPPGLACDASQITCFHPLPSGGDFALPGLAAGQYLLLIKATNPMQTGVVALRLTGSGTRKVEICANGVDDDNDGLIDCADPDCFGVGGCTASACTPDVNLGSLSIGGSHFVSLDIKGGQNLYQTSCSHGDGKERVVRINLTQLMTLGISCTETGSQVFELSQQLNPLDTCNANVVSCGDPEVLSFGCGYGVPDLQPGAYNLVVEAFQAGTEGTVNLTLSGEDGSVGEICDNGIDDDHDGAIDCFDLKCVTEPTCAKFACRPDQTLGLLPLNGAPTPVTVSTAMSFDDQHPACDSAPGGQDAVINFQLPALADLTIQWAQLGDHVFAIYADGGALLACDASTSLACFPTAGAFTGTQVFTRLPMGRYHLVVDAARPGSESGVDMRISAIPSAP